MRKGSAYWIRFAGWSLLSFLVGLTSQFLQSLAFHAPYVPDWIELIGFTTGILGVRLAVDKDILNFPVGIVNIVAYLYLYLWSMHHYANGMLQLIYLGFLIQGWAHWTSGREDDFIVTRMNRLWWPVLGVLVVAFTALQVPFLKDWLVHHDGMTSTIAEKIAVGDALTFSLSLVAQTLLNLKKLENWWVWVFADLIYVPFYIYRGYYTTAVLYFVFLLLCIPGYRQWRAALAN